MQQPGSFFAVLTAGYIDQMSPAQFFAQDTIQAYSGPLHTDEEFDMAVAALQLDTLTAEPTEGNGWRLCTRQHPFVHGVKRPQYCGAWITDEAGRREPCDQHARYHIDAPAHLIEKPARSLYPCHNARKDPIDNPQPSCNRNEGDIIVVINGAIRAYCPACALIASLENRVQ